MEVRRTHALRALFTKYAATHFELSWTDVFVGLKGEWLDPAYAIELAGERFVESDDPDELELAGLLKHEHGSALSVVQRLADYDLVDESVLLWMRLLMTCLHVNRAQFKSPLAIVESILFCFEYRLGLLNP